MKIELNPEQVRHIIKVLTADKEEALRVLRYLDPAVDIEKTKILRYDIELSEQVIGDLKKYLA